MLHAFACKQRGEYCPKLGAFEAEIALVLDLFRNLIDNGASGYGL